MEKDWEPDLHTRVGWGLPDNRAPFADVEGVSEHLKDYLGYYKELVSPGYAVLVTGEWGVGKTFQIKKLFPQSDAYYVSLFGLKCADDIAAAVFAAMYPTSTKIGQANKKFGDISIASGSLAFSAAGGLTSSVVSAFLKKRVNKDKPIIFDDLERCGVRSKELLGIINNYVEHHGCRVIAIAHDEKLVSAISEYKEKVFGQTIHLTSNVADVFDTVIGSSFKSTELAFLETHRDVILSTFEQSGATSLRILKQVLASCCRYYACFESRHIANIEAISRLLAEFVAFECEVREGRLGSETLNNVYVRAMASEDAAFSESVTLLRELSSKYDQIYIEAPTLGGQVLIDMHCHGRYAKTKIAEALSECSLLSEMNKSAWRKLISFDQLEDHQVHAAVQELEGQFHNRELHKVGEMLHMFSLRMMLAEYGELDPDFDEIVRECKRYIDDIRKKKLLPRKDADPHFTHSLSTGSYGYGYWVVDTYKANFNELLKYLIDAIEKATIDAMADEKDSILNEMMSDKCDLYKLICYTADGPNNLHHLPVFNSIKPAEFVDVFLKAPKANWRNIELALKRRRSNARRDESLKYEIEWVKTFAELLEEEAQKGQGLPKARLLRVSKHVLSDR